MKKMANASLDDFNHCKCYGTNKSFFVTVRKNREFEYREIIQLMCVCATNKVEHIGTVYINTHFKLQYICNKLFFILQSFTLRNSYSSFLFVLFVHIRR